MERKELKLSDLKGVRSFIIVTSKEDYIYVLGKLQKSKSLRKIFDCYGWEQLKDVSHAKYVGFCIWSDGDWFDTYLLSDQKNLTDKIYRLCR